MFIPNNNIKIVCKLERDAETINITSIQNNLTNYNKVKITTLASNVTIKDVFHFSPSFFYHSQLDGIGLVYYQNEGNTYKYTFQIILPEIGSYPVNFDYNHDTHHPNSLYDSTRGTGGYFNYEKFVLSNGKVVDLNRYQQNSSKSTSPWLSLNPSGKKISKTTTSSTIEIADVYDNTARKHSPIDPQRKIGTLPISYPYFDTGEQKVKIISFDGDARVVLLDAPSQYFTLELQDGNQHGYFSDENGNPSQYDNSIIQSEILNEQNDFTLDCTALDLVQLATIEEYAQKKLELEESYSAALSTAQVKGKAISTVVNRVKRQVEEDEAFKGDIKDLLKGDQGFKDSVKGDPGIQGLTGRHGISPTVKEVATELIAKKASELGKAVIDAESSSRNKSLSTRITYWLKDLLKGDQDFQENIADELLDRTNGNSIVSEVAKRINKRLVEDRAVRKVTDKIDVQDVVDRVDPDKAVGELIGAIGSNAAEQIIHDKIQGVNKNRFADKLVQGVGSKAKDIISDKITDPSLLIEKLLEKSPGAEQKIIGILTDPNNTELIIKAFAEKYPEVDIESIIRNLQRSHVQKTLNVRGSLKQTEEAIEKLKEDIQNSAPPSSANLIQSGVSQQEIDEAKKKAEDAAKNAETAQKSAENARNAAQGFANQAQSAAEEATLAKDSSINSLHELAQRYSNFNREKSNVLKKVHRVKRSVEIEGKSEETQQTLTIHDIRRLLEKKINGTTGKTRKDTQNMLSLSEEKAGKEIEKINSQVIQMGSDIEATSTKVEEIQERMQGAEQNIQQIGHDSSNAQRTNRKFAQRVDDSRIKAENAAEEAIDARDESQNFARTSQNSASEAQGDTEKIARAIKDIEEEIKDIEQRIPNTIPYFNAPQEKKDQLKIIQSNDNSTEIEIEGKGVIGKFSKAGYYFRSGQLHIHNPETGVDVAVPSEFYFLKVVKNPEMPTHYMLVLINQWGNELFEHKKYDPTFSSLADEFKSLDLQQIKTLNKINFQNGSYFILKPGAVSSQGYAVDVHEIVSNEKIGTLSDEFCYYQNGQFNYMNYHTGSEVHHSSFHEHYLSLSQSENYQAEASIVCGESSQKVSSGVNPIVTSEFGLLEYLADHNLV